MTLLRSPVAGPKNSTAAVFGISPGVVAVKRLSALPLDGRSTRQSMVWLLRFSTRGGGLGTRSGSGAL